MTTTRSSRFWTKILLCVICLCVLPATGEPRSGKGNILSTAHNLSLSGPGGESNLKSSQESRVCIFCHTPHHASDLTPLWSRKTSDLSIYTTYSSPTLQGVPDKPRGASLLCLSCHDGTIALGLLHSGYAVDPGLAAIPASSSAYLGTDLSDDHPISFSYLPAMDVELNDPGTLPETILLEDGEFLECTACHDPHNDEFGKFLAADLATQKDALCTTCHAKEGWNQSDAVHRTGGARFPTETAAVAAAGCMNCHAPHSAPGQPHLLKGATEENTCLTSCHRDAPYNSVYDEFQLLYRHPVDQTQGVHSAAEGVAVTTANKHVECVDCHNPHQTGAQGVPLGSSSPYLAPATIAPDGSGALRGVPGIDKNGATVDEALFEYEVCFRCHAGSSADQFASFGQRPDRVFADFDEIQRFDAGNPSYHPVTENRLGSGQSLLASYQLTMTRIYCGDCHHPHGSDEQHMLRAANAATFPAATTSYPLCFSCHDSDYLLNPLASPQAASVTLHREHVIDRAVPCSACHDPHGVPATEGASANNAAHLINFDQRYAGESAAFDAGAASCTVACHTSNPQTY